nr:nuclear transport factor 2 family protein [Bacteroidota bacterium]
MATFKETANEFYELIQNQNFIEALDKFYDDNIISTDNSNESTRGIENVRKSVEDFIANTEIKKIELEETMFEENISAGKWHYIFTNKNLEVLTTSKFLF